MVAAFSIGILMTQPLAFYRTSRSAIADRRECARLRLQAYDLDDTGYSMIGSTVPLLAGTSIHEAFAALWKTDDIEQAVTAGRNSFLDEAESKGFRFMEADEDIKRIVREQLWLQEMILRGWYRVRYPLLTAEYRPFLPPETSFDWHLSPHIVEPLRMDIILENRDTEAIVILDYKNTATADNAWFETHELSPQTILYIQALVEKLEEWGIQKDVEGMMYEGLVRGSFRKDDGKTSPFLGQRIQQTPWVYAYSGRDEDGHVSWQSDYTSRKGWTKTRVYDYFEGNPEGWLEQLAGEGKLQSLFATMPPANPPASIRTRLRRQMAHEEERWVAGYLQWKEMRARLGADHPSVEDFLDNFAPQNTQRCTKFGFENRCQFYGKGVGDGVCFMDQSTELFKEDPQYQPRLPHHPSTPSAEPFAIAA